MNFYKRVLTVDGRDENECKLKSSKFIHFQGNLTATKIQRRVSFSL